MSKQDRRGPSPNGTPFGGAANAAGGRWTARPAVAAGIIFGVLLAAYNVNGQFIYGNDAKPNVYLPAALLAGGGFTFTPSEYPFMFHWLVRTERGWQGITFNEWDQKVGPEPYTYRQLLQAGALKLYEPRYYLVPSVREPVDGNPLSVNTFGPGAGLTALPVFAVLHLAVGGDLRESPEALWYGGKAVASLLVAGSGAFVFLAARRLLAGARPELQDSTPAVLIALAYGLGTGVWSTSSQTLWQHGPNEFFLALGAYFLVRARDGWKHAAACGAALSAAVACRPTSVVVAAAVAVYLLVRGAAARGAVVQTLRRTLLPYVAAALPIAILLAVYNTHYLGKPWEFGQAMAGHQVAQTKTNSSDLWQTPLLTGAAGLMISPSRGLLVFSPVMAFAVVGFVLLWKGRRYAVLWPLAAAMVVLMVIAFKWFDWWGGWCYGPRPIVDTMPLLALMLVPVMGWVWRRRAALGVFVVLLAWSVFVQALGAFAYDMFGWNKRAMAKVYIAGRSEPVTVWSQEELTKLTATQRVERVEDVALDIDDPPNRHRLWSWSDNQIGFYITNYRRARQIKAEYIERYLRNPSY